MDCCGVVLSKVLRVACGCPISWSGVDLVFGLGVKHLEIVGAYVPDISG